MITHMKTLLHVGAIGLMLSMSALGGATLASARGDHDHGGSSGSGMSMSGSGEHGGGWGHSGGSGSRSGSGFGSGFGSPHRHEGNATPINGSLGSGSGGTEIDDSGLPVACGHVYTAYGVSGHRVCVTQ